MRLKYYAITLLIVSIFQYGYTEGKDAIAVNRLASTGISKGEAFTLTEALRSELIKTDKYDVMERSQMDNVLKEQGFQKTGACSDASCAVEIGQLLAVKYMVLGSVGKVGETFNLNIRLVDVGTGKIEKEVTQKHRGSKDDLLTETVPDAAKKLAGTYVEKKRTPLFVIGGTILAAAVGIPVAIFILKDDDSDNDNNESDLRVTW